MYLTDDDRKEFADLRAYARESIADKWERREYRNKIDALEIIRNEQRKEDLIERFMDYSDDELQAFEDDRMNSRSERGLAKWIIDARDLDKDLKQRGVFRRLRQNR